MRVALLVAAAAVVLPISVSAQAPRTLTITRDLLIPPADADLTDAGFVAISPGGHILVAQMKEKLIKVFLPNGEVSAVGRGGSGPGEFQRLTRIGFVGDTLWALDPSLARVSIFGPDLKYVRSFPEPLSEMTAKTELQLAYYTQAVLPGGDLRAIASLRPTAARPTWAIGVDSGSTIIVRLSANGAFKKRLMVAPPSKCIINYSFEKGTGTTMIPFCPERISTEWSGGVGIASASVEATDGKANRYRVTVVDDQGAMRFTRSIPFVPIPVSKGALDSSATRRAKILKDSPPAIVAAMPNPKPYPTFPPIRNVILGRDYSVWIEERITGPGHRWLVLDPKGVTVGVVTVPKEVALRAAELGVAWGIITDADDVQGVVRYRVGH